MKVRKMTKNVLMLFCVIFSCATLFSCVINLALGYATDTYAHMIDRAILTLIGSLVLLKELEIKNVFLNFFVPYIIFIILAMLYVFVTSFWEQLHQNAYRDVFLNDTIVYIVVFATMKIYNNFKGAKIRNTVHPNISTIKITIV